MQKTSPPRVSKQVRVKIDLPQFDKRIDLHCVFVQRIAPDSRLPESPFNGHGYLISVFGPFTSHQAATDWIPTCKRIHPRFNDDNHYWIGTRPITALSK